jgi:hypothetical protein
MKFLKNCPVDVLKIVEDFDPGFFYLNYNQKILKTIEAETKFPAVLSKEVMKFIPIMKFYEIDDSKFFIYAQNEEQIEEYFVIEEALGYADTCRNSLKTLLRFCNNRINEHDYSRKIQLMPLQNVHRMLVEYGTKDDIINAREEERIEFPTIPCAFMIHESRPWDGWICEDLTEVTYYLQPSAGSYRGISSWISY